MKAIRFRRCKYVSVSPNVTTNFCEAIKFVYTYILVYKKITEVDKQRQYDAYNRGEDYFDLARQLGIKRTTAWSIIIKRTDENDGQVSQPRGGARRASSTNVTDIM